MKHLAFLSFCVTAVASGGAARAADTTETFDVGATDAELYMGFDGIGNQGGEGALYGDILLGYGLVEGFSAYLGTTLSASEFFTDGNADVYLGIFGTPIDTDHLDLDLFMDVAAGGGGFDEFTVTPATELNVDVRPDTGLWGLYLRAGVPIYGHIEESEGGDLEHRRTADVELTPGTYWTLAERHQILLEYDMALHPAPSPDERAVDVGGVALGYNVAIAGPIELVTQVYLDIPQQDEPATVGVMAGFIATMPSPHRSSVAQLTP